MENILKELSFLVLKIGPDDATEFLSIVATPEAAKKLDVQKQMIDLNSIDGIIVKRHFLTYEEALNHLVTMEDTCKLLIKFLPKEGTVIPFKKRGEMN